MSISINIKLDNIIRRIDNNTISIDEISNFLSNLDKDFRETLITECLEEDVLIGETLKKANNQMEQTRKNIFIHTVKNNTYKDYLNRLTLTQIYDLKETITKEMKISALYNIKKHKEYEEYVELLAEKISLEIGTEIVDFRELEELFKTLTIEEIAAYLKTYPDIFIFMDPIDKEVEKKMTEASELIKNIDIEKITDDKLIYKKRKYF